MLKSKIVRLLNNCKELVIRRKKEIAISAAGVVVLGGIGYGTYYMTRDTDSDVATSNPVVEEQVESSGETSETVEDQNENTEVNSETTESTTENTENSGSVAQTESKDDTSSNEENKGGSTVNNTTGFTENKPSTGGNTSSGSGNTSNGGSSSTTPKPENKPVIPSKPENKPSTGGDSKPSHSHNWVAQTKQVYHKEQGHYENVLVKPAWTEKVPVYEERERSICNGCGKDITADPYTHNENHMLNGEKGGWHSEWKKVQVGTKTVKHDAVYSKKWVVDKKAWTETVVTGHKCSGCGQTK